MERTAVREQRRSGRRPGTTRAAKRERQRQMSELVSHYPITSQQEFVDLLAARGFAVTQATVSRDIAELGLVKVARADRHVYAVPHDLGPTIRAASDERLRRILADYPVQVRRSGLILLLLSVPGSAAAISQAIDDSTFDEQEGTLAGDDTVLVLFADEGRLERWRARFETLRVGDPREADAVPGGGYGSGAGAVPGGRYGSGAGAVPGGGAVRGGAVRRSGTGG